MTLHPIGLIVKPVTEAQETADRLEAWIQDRGVAVERIQPNDIDGCETGHACPPHPERPLACVFVLGGDGTFLSAVRWIGDAPIPILGVKFGEVGFLAEIAAEDLFAAAASVLGNNFDIQIRMRLAVAVMRDGTEYCRESVLNDVVINTGTLARLALIPTYINDHYLTTFRADGLIVASPTGSTAYSLAAGGPVVHPQVPGIVMTPICPFTLTNRPLVVPDSTRILIKPEERSTNLILTLDGQAGLEIQHGDAILIEKSPHPVHMIQIPDGEYFDVLKAKLSWSGGRA
jgi:NAD+ kinase